MNRKPSRAVVAVLFLVVAVGCATTPDRVALNSLKSIRATAERSVAVFKAGRLATPPLFTDAQEVKARDLYAKYLQADRVAAEALLVAKTVKDREAFIPAVANAAADLIAFVESLKKKGP